ncbi:Yip1 domain protein [Ichthyophthirius multifiliis]|uniref:Protein YIPF n=1 Tax=Ichthyophthirius multifiliis TaxID=5932 RepID=G0QN67_ICHMU|nr:Yip1 domain protein [Ichthyophthirius multifiliis]EGR33339.1 Yip1 domain protein [Ichthyophthirius multifiliis]|eukprot:XP_004037325.1 Yip1 domain protein [Ichthyophthirius multifiliis]
MDDQLHQNQRTQTRNNVNQFIPQQQQQYQQQYQQKTLSFDPNNIDPDNEPPLLEDLGIDLQSIKQRILIVLKIKQCDKQYLEDTDLAGPILFGFILGFLLMLSGKLHFGYIYGFGISGTIGIYCIMNFLSRNAQIDLYTTLSILGYCIIPLIFLSLFNIFISLQNLFGTIFAILTILWCTSSASNFFVEMIQQDHIKYLVAYPTLLFYSIFVMLTIF